MTNITTKSILVIDDDPAIIQSIFKHFSITYSNYHLLSAPNGRIGLQIALKEQPDLIILDWQMPEMNGIQVIQYLQKNDVTRHTPIIVTTGINLEDVHLEEALKAGAIDYLRKPFNRVEFLARSQTALRLAELHHKEKQLMQSVIAHKNRELSTAMIHAGQKNQLLIDIQKQLKNNAIAPHLLEQILKSIQNNLHLDNYWDKFKLHFEEVHPCFFARLQTQFENLTTHELKLCAYIKINLADMDIAQILNVSYKAVEVARYRIKKKLKLSAKDNLSKFIQQF